MKLPVLERPFSEIPYVVLGQAPELFPIPSSGIRFTEDRLVPLSEKL